MNMKEVGDWVAENVAPLAIVSIGGACSAAVAKAGVFYLGRFFTPTQFGIESLVLAGVIGAVQGFIPWTLGEPMKKFLFSGETSPTKPEKKETFYVAFFLTHQAVTLGLVALTAAAAKAGLIASGMTLFGGVALFATSYAVNYGIDQAFAD